MQAPLILRGQPPPAVRLRLPQKTILFESEQKGRHRPPLYLRKGPPLALSSPDHNSIENSTAVGRVPA
jgi:hypothetical protein